MPGCKVGDLVVFIGASTSYNSKLIGAVGTVTATSDSADTTSLAGPYWKVHCPTASQIFPGRFKKGYMLGVPDSVLQPIRPLGISKSSDLETPIEIIKELTAS